MGHIEWTQLVYKLSKETTICTSYPSLQYTILTRIVATNGLLYRIGIKDSDNCERCSSTDTILHRFWSCPEAQLFWREIQTYLIRRKIVQHIPSFVREEIIMGYFDLPIVNHIVLIGKTMISRRIYLSVNVLLNRLKADMNTEKYIAIKNNKLGAYDKKWACMKRTLEENWEK